MANGFDIGAVTELLGSDPFQVGTMPTAESFNLPSVDIPTSTDYLKTLGGYAKEAMPILQAGTTLGSGALGILGIQQAGQLTDIASKSAKTAQAAAKPAVASAQALTPAGTQALLGGPLPPELEAEVTAMMNNARAQIRQLAASLGIPEGTAEAQMEGWIQEQAATMRTQLAQGLLAGGTGATGAAVGAAGTAGELAGSQAASQTAAVTAANQALMRLLAQQG
jgi:hypothetical protein